MAIENTGIYEIRNIHNGNRYIGSATRIDGRWRDHKRSLGRNNHHAIAMQRAWNKYGESAFEFSKLLICSKENLIMYEQAFFDFYSPAYNSAPIAGSQIGYRHTEISRKKMSASRRKDFSPMKGRSHSDEAKAKMAAANSGVVQSQETIRQRMETILSRHGKHPAKRKFTERDIRQMRARMAAGEPAVTLCAEYKVSSSVMSEIKNFNAYKWVN